MMSDVSILIVLLISGSFLLGACSTDNQQDKKIGDSGNSSNNSPKSISHQQMLEASLDGNLEVIEKAVAQDVNVTESDELGRTPLMLASYNGHSKIVQYLLKQGGDPARANKRGQTPLIFAASGSHPRTVEILLDNGADPNKVSTKESWSALMWAAAEGNEQVVNVLLKHGADPNLRDNDDETARDFAESNGHQSIAKTLKQAEANNRN